AHELIAEQCRRIAVPKRFTLPIREIWDMQERLPRRQGKRADALLENPRFRAGYDFLLLRESAGEQTGGLGDWWTRYQEVDDSTRRAMIRDLGKEDGGAAPRRRRRSPRKRRPAQQPDSGNVSGAWNAPTSPWAATWAPRSSSCAPPCAPWPSCRTASSWPSLPSTPAIPSARPTSRASSTPWRRWTPHWRRCSCSMPC